MTRKYTKKIVESTVISFDKKRYQHKELTIEEDMEKVEICTSLFHLLPLGALRELFKLAQTVSAKIK